MKKSILKKIFSAVLTVLFVVAMPLTAQQTIFASEGFTTEPMIAAGSTHNVALKSDGTVWAWGENDYRQLGDGTRTNSSKPVQTIGLTDIIAVTAGSAHSAALKSDGTVWSWGSNECGELANGTKTSSAAPVQALVSEGVPLDNVVSISAGSAHTVALKSDGSVWLLGHDDYPILHAFIDPPLNAIGRTFAVQISGLDDVTSIASGGWHIAALKSEGTVWTLGYNCFGQLGNGTDRNRGTSTPVQVLTSDGLPLRDVTSIAAGMYQTHALKRDGTVWAWGNNEYGQLGDGQVSNGFGIDSPTPVQALISDGLPLSGVTAIALDSRGYHTIALKSDGTLWAWGWNNHGVLGDGTTIHRYNPVQMFYDNASLYTNVVDASTGGYHTALQKSDGTVWTLGENHFAQLGNGTTTDSLIPVQVVSENGEGFFNLIAPIPYIVKSGEKISVPITLKSCNHFAGMQATVAYDKSLLTLEKITGESGFLLHFQDNRFVVATSEGHGVDGDVVVGSVVFTAKADLDEDDLTSVKFGQITAVDGSLAYITPTVPNILINILAMPSLLGDVTLDGKINAADPIILLQYLAGNRELNSKQLRSADINGDSAVSIADVILIMQMCMA